jgi:hypothetical protein
LVAAAWVWQLGYAAFAAIVEAVTEPPRCIAGWSWPEPLPWSACRGFGLSDRCLHLIGIPGDFAMYPFSIWPGVMQTSVYQQPLFWLQSAIYIAALWWLLQWLVRRAGVV